MFPTVDERVPDANGQRRWCGGGWRVIMCDDDMSGDAMAGDVAVRDGAGWRAMTTMMMVMLMMVVCARNVMCDAAVRLCGACV